MRMRKNHQISASIQVPYGTQKLNRRSEPRNECFSKSAQAVAKFALYQYNLERTTWKK